MTALFSSQKSIDFYSLPIDEARKLQSATTTKGDDFRMMQKYIYDENRRKERGLPSPLTSWYGTNVMPYYNHHVNRVRTKDTLNHISS